MFLRHARFARPRVNSTRGEVAPIQELGVRNCVMGKSGADSRVRVRNRVICAARKYLEKEDESGPEHTKRAAVAETKISIFCLAEEKNCSSACSISDVGSK